MSSSDASSSATSSGSETSKRGVKRKRDNIPNSSVSKTRKATPEDAHADSNPNSDDSDSDPGSNLGDGDVVGDIQVLSHAALRKQKRKEQKEAKGSTGHKPPSTDVPPKRQNSVWVGNLAFKTTEQSLRAFFERNIPGCEVTRVNLPKKTGKDVGDGKGMRGENKGFAYVDFTTKEAQGKAIGLSEQNLDGRKLLIKDGGDFAGRPTAGPISTKPGVTVVGSVVGKSKTAQRILAAQKQPPAPTLFLGNLGFQATEESIRGMLEGHRKSRRQDESMNGSKKDDIEEKLKEAANDKKWLRKVRLGTFEDSGLCKGWAFVDFFTVEDATDVLIDTRNHNLDGRKLKIEYASADAVRRGGGPGAKEHRDRREVTKETSEAGQDKRRGRGDSNFEKRYKGQPVAETTQDKDDEPPQKKIRTPTENERERGGGRKRTKPGAALALAKREQVAIVQSTGKKIVF